MLADPGVKQLFEKTSSKYFFLVSIGIGMVIALGGAFLDATLSFMCELRYTRVDACRADTPEQLQLGL